MFYFFDLIWVNMRIDLIENKLRTYSVLGYLVHFALMQNEPKDQG